MKYNSSHPIVPDSTGPSPEDTHSAEASRPSAHEDHRATKIFFGVLYALLLSCAAGFCLYRYLCEFHAPESSVTEQAASYVYPAIDLDGNFECTVVPDRDYDRISAKISVELSNGSYLSSPVITGLSLQKETPSSFVINLNGIHFYKVKNGKTSSDKTDITALLAPDTQCRLVFTYIGEPVFESAPFYLAPFMKGVTE